MATDKIVSLLNCINVHTLDPMHFNKILTHHCVCSDARRLMLPCKHTLKMSFQADADSNINFYHVTSIKNIFIRKRTVWPLPDFSLTQSYLLNVSITSKR